MEVNKSLHHAKRWDVYNSEKGVLIKYGFYFEVTYKDRKKLIWEVVYDHVVEEGVEHEELGIQSFDFNLFN